ncbi:MAG: pyridoxal-phosphate dependent enzyme, partial [Planctomycetes bacterium]|nr:pyridoxal-phosphate dependent enzyme [Planctomycetota bacterium]
MDHYAADLQSVREAAERIARFARRTPVETCGALDRMAGRELFFKCEHLQKVGAFKFRGACNAVMKLDDETAARGVVTHSSGNHAQALALAAKLRG